MKTYLLSFTLLFVFVSAMLSQTKYSVATAKSFIKQFPDPDSIHWRGNSNHFDWQAGYIMFAMEKLWRATNDSTFFNYVKRYVDQQVDDQGNIPDFKPNALDHFIPGYAILFMYEQTHLEKYKIAAQKIRDGFRDYPRTQDGLFWHANWAKHQAWVDGVYMGQIFLARYGKVIGDSEYAFNEVVKQMTLIAEHCQKPNGLLLHGWDDSKQARWANKETGLAPEVWSEGLGWYAVLIADIFDYLPENQTGYSKIKDIHAKLCQGLKNAQNPRTGMWCQVVDKCNEPGNWDETSGSGMFLYLIKRLMDKGYIKAGDYNAVVKKAYDGIIKKAQYNMGYIDLLQCSSIGIKNDYQDYVSQPKETSTFAAFGSFILGTLSVEYTLN